MKTAILITAYKSIDQLIDIINYFDDRFNIYIHYDKKNVPKEIHKLAHYKNVNFSSFYKVNWGSLNHLKAILFLSKIALSNKDNTYFHLISGEDFPTKSLDFYFNTNKNYIQFELLPTESWSGNGGLDRYDYFNLFDCLTIKNKYRLIKINHKVISFQKALKLKRKKINFDFMYGGGTWWSLTREALDFVANNTANDAFLKRMRFCFCSEEIYFQTVLMNSLFKDSLQNNNLRYIDWTSKRGGAPAFLDSTDFEKIINNDYLFARKFDHKASNHLKQMLIEYNK